MPGTGGLPGGSKSMADSIRDLIFGPASGGRELVDAVEPRRSFDDVVLPATTLRALNHALALVRKHDLIFQQWGLAERHSSGLGLAFHLARPPRPGQATCGGAPSTPLGPPAPARRSAPRRSPMPWTRSSWSCVTPSSSPAGWVRPPST